MSGLYCGIYYKITAMYDEEKGFGEFYDVTYSALYGYVRGKMGADTSIEDILQETYFEAYKKREKLKSHPKPVGWLFKTADFMIKNWKRRKDNQIVSLEIFSDMSDKLYVCEEYEKIEWRLMLQEILSETERELVRLHYQERYSSAEIAALYGMTEGNIRVRLCRIRRKIREKMRGDDWAETQESYY